MFQIQPDSPRDCMVCRFSVSDDVDPSSLKRVTRCRRFPPTVTTVLTPEGIVQATAWPQVQAGGWCHEFQPVERVVG